jgi:hypothetical protein
MSEEAYSLLGTQSNDPRMSKEPCNLSEEAYSILSEEAHEREWPCCFFFYAVLFLLVLRCHSIAWYLSATWLIDELIIFLALFA